MSNNIIKETIEWRLIALVITFIITYTWTGKIIEASGLTISLNLAKTLAFYMWRKFKQGPIKPFSRESDNS